MTPSTENTDRLLEWHPGPPDAATTNVFAALAWGARRAWNSKLLLGYLWLFYFLLVEGAGSAILAALRASTNWSTTARSVAAESVAGSLFSAQTIDAGYSTILIESVARPLWSPSAYFVLFFGVIAGGSIAYLHAPRPAPLLAQLGASCGNYLGRFVRLILIAASIFWLLTVIASALFDSGTVGSSVWVRLVLFQLTIAFWATVVDYARVRTVARDSRSMLIETVRSLGFVVRNLARILPLEILFVALAFVAGAVVLTAAGALRGLLPVGAVAFVAEQVYVMALLCVRLTVWGAMLALYQGISLERLSKANA